MCGGIPGGWGLGIGWQQRLTCRLLVGHPPALQVKESHDPDALRLRAIPSCRPELQQLVWDCTNYDRRTRPTAAEVVRRLDAMLAAL